MRTSSSCSVLPLAFLLIVPVVIVCMFVFANPAKANCQLEGTHLPCNAAATSAAQGTAPTMSAGCEESDSGRDVFCPEGRLYNRRPISEGSTTAAPQTVTTSDGCVRSGSYVFCPTDGDLYQKLQDNSTTGTQSSASQTSAPSWNNGYSQQPFVQYYNGGVVVGTVYRQPQTVLFASSCVYSRTAYRSKNFMFSTAGTRCY